MTENTQAKTYQTLEEITQRKEELRTQIQTDSKQIATHWHNLTVPQEANSKGELITNLISNSITAIDAFLLARKLMKIYGKYFTKRKNK
jgi:hypothetical protein